jgi:adenylylsulfate reductase subunit B
VKACPQHAIDVRGYADFNPLGHSVRVHRDTELQTVFWKIRYRDGRLKEFEFPIRTTPWGSIQGPADYVPPDMNTLDSPLLAHEPEALKVDQLPRLPTGVTP